MRGVVPSAVTRGAAALSKSVRPKKAPAVSASMVGVTSAATPQPKTLKMRRPRSIMKRVTVPVALEKAPMNSE